MVVFECQKCNETLKKPKLMKHLQACRSDYVTCIDCSKVFRWDEWEAHTSCVSEAQKYQGKLFEAKESSNKGKVKQDNWTESVQKSIEEAGDKINPQIKGLLEKLLSFDNIPRKQKPFANFVKNSLKLWDDRKIAEIWTVINSANEKMKKPAASPEEPPLKKVSDNNDAKAWAGWKRTLDDELKAAGGELPWKKLRDSLVKRYHESSAPNGMSEEQLGHEALAAIPAVYLSKEDDLVRLCCM